MSAENLDSYYRSSFIPRAHRVGRTTLLIGMVLCILPALYLSFVHGAFPGFGPILQGYIAIAAFVGIFWLVEPISYFPILGVCGSYMSFLSGNIGNMRVPVVISCQDAIDAEMGSRRAEIAAVIGIAVSVIVNLVLLVAVVVLGRSLIQYMPEAVLQAIQQYTVPALFGAVVVMFISSATRTYAIVGIAVALVIFVSPLPKIMSNPVAGIVGLLVAFLLAQYQNSRAETKNDAAT